MSETPLIWVGTSLENVRSLSAEARSNIGFQLRRVQRGLLQNDWKPMVSVGPGVCELRTRGYVDHRVLYIAKYEEAVYVLHAFEKRSRKTRQSDIAVANERLRQVKRLRREHRERGRN